MTEFYKLLRSIKAHNLLQERKAMREPVKPYVERKEPFSDEQFPKHELSEAQESLRDFDREEARAINSQNFNS
jgi:hypothetical protein